MDEKENLTKKFIMVRMNDAQITTEEMSIIGTEALATCVGVLLYSKEKKVAIVAHASVDPMIVIDKIFELIIKNRLNSVVFKYEIIPGYEKEHSGIEEALRRHFTHFIPFNDNEISEGDIRTNEEYISREFAFDASTGEFVTDKVYFGIEYECINKVSGKTARKK